MTQPNSGTGSTEQQQTQTGQQTGGQTTDQQQTQTGSTGDNGRRGGEDQLRADLARERDERQRAEREAQAKDAELAELRKQNETDNQRAVREAAEAARKDERDKAEARERELTGERVRDRIEVAAAGRFNDPTDAYANLSAQGLLPGLLRDGKPDETAIKSAVDKLLEAKPYLAKAGQGGTGGGRDDDRRRRETGRGSAHQGAGRGGDSGSGSDVRDRQLARARARDSRGSRT